MVYKLICKVWSKLNSTGYGVIENIANLSMKADKWSKCNYLSFITNTDRNNYYYEVKRGLVFFIWMKKDRPRGVIVIQIDITLLSDFADFSNFV